MVFENYHLKSEPGAGDLDLMLCDFPQS